MFQPKGSLEHFEHGSPHRIRRIRRNIDEIINPLQKSLQKDLKSMQKKINIAATKLKGTKKLRGLKYK
jgi:hypothetical protein